MIQSKKRLTEQLLSVRHSCVEITFPVGKIRKSHICPVEQRSELSVQFGETIEDIPESNPKPLLM